MSLSIIFQIITTHVLQTNRLEEITSLEWAITATVAQDQAEVRRTKTRQYCFFGACEEGAWFADDPKGEHGSEEREIPSLDQELLEGVQ